LSLYVYALADAPGGSAVGLAGEAIRWLACGEMHAAVGEMQRAPEVLPELARGHDAAVRALAANVRALLPARFGSVLRDDAALEEALTPRAQELRQALELVAGREQMTLRILNSERTDRPPTLESVEGAGSGSRYLRWRAELQRVRHSAPELDPIRALISPLVKAERIERRPEGALVASVFHLVERGESDRYRELLTEAGAGIAPVRLSVSGPWPAYAFAPELLS
jgi:hypothetical protein